MSPLKILQCILAVTCECTALFARSLLLPKGFLSSIYHIHYDNRLQADFFHLLGGSKKNNSHHSIKILQAACD